MRKLKLSSENIHAMSFDLFNRYILPSFQNMNGLRKKVFDKMEASN